MVGSSTAPRVLCVVWGEAFWEHAVLTQTVEVMRTVQREGHARVTLVCFVPFLALFRKRGEVRAAVEALKADGVRTLVLPVPLVFTRSLYGHFALLPLALAAMVPVLLVKGLRHDLLHPRGYFAGLAACVAARVLRRPFVFDPRSPFAEENARINAPGFGSFGVWLWKGIERLLLRCATCVVATSPAFATDLQAAAPEARIEIIPNNSLGCLHDGPSRAELRVKLGFDSEDLVLAYAGSIGHWNDAGLYVGFHYELIGQSDRVRFLYLVPKLWQRHLLAALAAYQVPEGTYVVLSVPPEEVCTYLTAADAGVQLMPQPDARLGVKIADYLVAGLPLVVNQYARGAVQLVATSGVGLVVDLSDAEYAQLTVAWLGSRRREDCRSAVAALGQQFSTARVAERWSEVYRCLVGNGPRDATVAKRAIGACDSSSRAQ
ncbi:MAG: glycosyltransferase [Anaerolineae bacterium]